MDAEFTAPHETDELWPFDVSATVAGLPVVVGVDACLLPRSVRPTDASWLPAVVRDGVTHVLVRGQQPGWHTVWARASRGDEHVVLELQPILLT